MSSSSINHSCLSAPSQLICLPVFPFSFHQTYTFPLFFLFIWSASSYLSSLHPCLLNSKPFYPHAAFCLTTILLSFSRFSLYCDSLLLYFTEHPLKRCKSHSFSWLARGEIPDTPLSWHSSGSTEALHTVFFLLLYITWKWELKSKQTLSPYHLYVFQMLCTRFQRSWRGLSTWSLQPTLSL